MKHNLNIEELLKLRKEGLSFTMIGKKLGVSREVIKYQMKKIGITNSVSSFNLQINTKYKCNINYFEKIDSEDKAYFLGLLYADGCVRKYISKDITHKTNLVQCTLHKKDEYLLELFRKYTNNEFPLSKPKNKNVAIFLSHNKYWVNDLIKLGCTPKKSLTLKFPTEEQVPKELIHHFIRGYFDGDGSVFKYTREKYTQYFLSVGICGTFEFCKSIQELLESINIKSSICKVSNIFSLRVTRKEDIFYFYKYLYNDSTIYMSRKFDKFNQFYQQSNKK